jgi:hemerythrin-like metal-binding protein
MVMNALQAMLADSKGINREHMVQARLMQAVAGSVARSENGAEALTQLSDYSRAHYLSEETLMRLYAYPDLPAHQHDHEEMVAWLDELLAKKDDREAMTHAIEELTALFLRHIDGHDVSLHDFLADLPN